MRIALVDDRQEDRNRLAEDIHAYESEKQNRPAGGGNETECFRSGEEFLGVFAPGMFDAVFLDIYMDGINGIELAEKIREKDTGIRIIFLSTSSDFAFEAFPVHAFDYLVKPYSKEDLHRVLRELERIVPDERKEILIREAYHSLSVPTDSIISIQANGHSLDIWILGGSCVRSIMTFSEVSALLETEPEFLHCNRGVIVNMNHVLSLEDGVMHMKEGPDCTLRIRGKAKLTAIFAQYQISRMKRGTGR